MSFIRQDGAGVCCRSNTSMHVSSHIVRHEMASQGCYHVLRIRSCIAKKNCATSPRNQQHECMLADMTRYVPPISLRSVDSVDLK
jgi:hypothetical protein